MRGAVARRAAAGDDDGAAAGGMGDPDSLGSFQLPADLAAGLPKELQEQCVVR
jgi:hypothetical protein